MTKGDTEFFLLRHKDGSTSVQRIGIPLEGVMINSGTFDEMIGHQARVCRYERGLMVLKLLPSTPKGRKSSALKLVADVMRAGQMVRPLEEFPPLCLRGHYSISSAHQPTGKRDVYVCLDDVEGLFPFYVEADRKYLFEVVGEEQTLMSDGYEKPDS